MHMKVRHNFRQRVRVHALRFNHCSDGGYQLAHDLAERLSFLISGQTKIEKMTLRFKDKIAQNVRLARVPRYPQFIFKYSVQIRTLLAQANQAGRIIGHIVWYQIWWSADNRNEEFSLLPQKFQRSSHSYSNAEGTPVGGLFGVFQLAVGMLALLRQEGT
jgi:hypothetical protein